MNTDILFAGQGESARLAAGFGKAHDLIFEGEQRFSRFLENSELSRMNRSAGLWFSASPEMFAVLRLVQRYHHLTAGLFDPSILPDLRRAGYDRSMDAIRAMDVVPAPETAAPPEARPALTGMKLNLGKRQVFLPEGLAIDLGGIAKGWLAEQAAQMLSDYSEACAVNAGGDMYLFGHPSGSAQWPIALEDPREPGRMLSTLYVPSGGVATSSMARRAWRQSSAQGELTRHHLIDPRTGEPSQGDWLSVTVISTHAHLSEVLAKALLIGGPLEADKLTATGSNSFSYIAVDREGKLSGTHRVLEIFNER